MEKRTIRKANRLLSLLSEMPPQFNKIEAKLKRKAYTSEVVTLAACEFALVCFCEYGDFVDRYDREPRDEEVHSSYLYKICELLLRYGLNPNQVFDDDTEAVNLMHHLQYVDYAYAAPETMRLLLENGADPQSAVIEGESVFDDIDFDVMFNAREYPDIKLFDIGFRLWLLMIGYGAVLSNGKCPINIIDGYDIENFKEFEKFSCDIEITDNDWFIHIFDDKLGMEVANL